MIRSVWWSITTFQLLKPAAVISTAIILRISSLFTVPDLPEHGLPPAMISRSRSGEIFPMSKMEYPSSAPVMSMLPTITVRMSSTPTANLSARGRSSTAKLPDIKRSRASAALPKSSDWVILTAITLPISCSAPPTVRSAVTSATAKAGITSTVSVMSGRSPLSATSTATAEMTSCCATMPVMPEPGSLRKTAR